MSRANAGSAGGGIGIMGVLQIIFIVLKLIDVIDWSWWVVFIPTFISCGFTGIVLIIIAIYGLCKIYKK